MPSPRPENPSLGFIGGTGPEGRGLALRFAAAACPVVIGSRSRERAEETAGEIRRALPHADVVGMPNDEAAGRAEINFLTIPYSGVRTTVPPLAAACTGKIVVSAIAPIEFREGRPAAVEVEAGSVAQEVQELLPGARVVSAFQVVDSHQLGDLAIPLDTDVLVCSDDQEARRAIVQLAGRLPGIRALSAGRLASSRYVEACTGLLITVNRIYKVHSGIRLTGLPR